MSFTTLRSTLGSRLRCRRSLENFDQIIGQLAAIADRFTAALDCADIGFLPDGVLDELPLPAQAGASRIAGIDLNKPRIRAALAAAHALAPAPGGFTAAQHAARVRQITGQDGYTTRRAAYDLRKLRGKQLIDKPGRTRRYHVPPDGARTIAALLTLRDHVIAPILAGVRSPLRGRKPRSGPRLTAITKPSASTCKPCSGTSASTRSQRPHKQHFVDGMMQAPSCLSCRF